MEFDSCATPLLSGQIKIAHAPLTAPIQGIAGSVTALNPSYGAGMLIFTMLGLTDVTLMKLKPFHGRAAIHWGERRFLISYARGPILGATKLTKNSTKKTTNRICAIQVAVPAMPPNPKTAAINAMIKNVTAQLNMIVSLSLGGKCCSRRKMNNLWLRFRFAFQVPIETRNCILRAEWWIQLRKSPKPVGPTALVPKLATPICPHSCQVVLNRIFMST